MSNRNNAKQMARLLERRRRRGLTWNQLAAETGISKNTLYWWERRLRDTRSSGKRSRFVEVTIPESIAAPAVELVLRNGRVVRVVPGFDTDHVRRVIEVAEAGC
jgi:DNA-binding XRE family transcriptional regulator